ncbi:hypothetical protein K469DRAFT_598722, partial [Zopfia rhizophila CBS 207.26]
KSLIIIIIGTGAGKSIAFILPALYSTGITIIVVPLVLLQKNLKNYYIKAGIKYVKWDS